MTSINETLIAALETSGGDFIDAPIILEASALLELLGEDVRGRLCSFSNQEGEELCLRPDMTVPIAMQAAGAKPARYRYSGPVFRLPAQSGDPVEFTQTGFEWIGEASSPKQDAEGLAVVFEALGQAGVKSGALHFGDSALYSALIDALDLPDAWSSRLNKAFKRRRGPQQLIKGGATAGLSPLAKALAGLPEAEARAAVEEVFTATGISAVGGRDAGDIAARLAALSRDHDAGDMPQIAKTAISAFMEIEGPAGRAVEEIAALAKAANISLDAALETYTARLDALDAVKPKMASEPHFGAAFGRRFDYYDGLVFEVVHDGAGGNGVVASGGRYDSLIRDITNGVGDASAFGVAMRPERVAQAAAQEAGA